MKQNLRIVMAQLNFIVGDIAGNVKKHISAAKKARDELNADVIIFPELSLTGYPPEDLLLRPSFLDEAEDALKTLCNEIQGIYCIVGHPQRSEKVIKKDISKDTSKGLFNSASVIYNGRVLATCAKRHLPNYTVFDEKRYFIPGEYSCVVPICGVPVSILICEDLWFAGPTNDAAHHGAKLILSPNASPFEIHKHERRIEALTKRAKSTGLPIFYNNCVGGQDDLIFDGGSMVVDGNGEICQMVGFFEEKLYPVDVDTLSQQISIPKKPFAIPAEDNLIYSALVMGVKDYVEKNNFKSVLLGVSGGIDSALVLCIAVDALGPERVTAVMMPSRYTSAMSKEDALTLANNLNVKHLEIPIEEPFQGFISALAPTLGKNKLNIVDENMQARCRGTILMALSNNSGALVLTAGNRSELATGYATLYGDMAGGFSVLKDISKMLVYRLAKFRNNQSPVIPNRILERAPSAELAFEQKDEDTLPPYPTLDKILDLYLNQLKSSEEIIKEGFDKDVVEKVIRWIRINEYKRRQAPIGIRIDNSAFGRDRRYPVTNRYKG